jgi:hypothetical protein
MIQDAKDTFYMALRDRLVVANPQGIMLVRGAMRPGILVEEAEPTSSELPLNVFVLRWTQTRANAMLPTTMSMVDCEILYGTSGTEAACGLDRSRLLSAMDKELTAMLQPSSAPVLDQTVNPAAATGATAFWTNALFGSTLTERDCLKRVVIVTVIARDATGGQG